MIGLPYQTVRNLEEDLDFLESFDIDMVGMGPYIPHRDTPLGQLALGVPSRGKSPAMTAISRVSRKSSVSNFRYG